MTAPIEPIRILIAALGGEGGGVLMNWLVDAARAAGLAVQATSVPGVAQRTGSTTYYIEVAPHALGQPPVLSLVPMPGRVDLVVSSELVETARVLAQGFVSPKRTTLITSTARQLTTAEKMTPGDGRYDTETIKDAARALAKTCLILDLDQLATAHKTFVSATMFGALAGSGALPWDVDISRQVLGQGKSAKASLAGFEAAFAAASDAKGAPPRPAPVPSDLPSDLQAVISHGVARCLDYQDAAYADLYRARAMRLAAADLTDHRRAFAVTEACRRLALWMTYEDIARVADLKTRPERFDRIRSEAQMSANQTLTVIEYMKPRAEEIADVMPDGLGRWIMTRVEAGKGLPFVGRGINLRSNGVFGYHLLRSVAQFRRLRRRSYRYKLEQIAIDRWLALMDTALVRSPDFAAPLGELPRVLKGYSDTLVRGRAAYDAILTGIVEPAVMQGALDPAAPVLRAAIAAAMSDETHVKLQSVLAAAPVPNLRSA